MMNQIKEKSPRPDVAGRDEKAISNEINYNITDPESKVLISILGQKHIIKMLFLEYLNRCWYDDEIEAVKKSSRDYAKELEKIKDSKLKFDLDRAVGTHIASYEEQGFFYGVRYALDFLFGGELFED